MSSFLQHKFLRLYATLHLVAMYTMDVSCLPAMGDLIRRHILKEWLDALGLWEPSVGRSIAPVLALLLLVSLLAAF